MKYLYSIFIIVVLFSCRKKEYKSYVGNYNCHVTYHDDSTASDYTKDTSYTEMKELVKVDAKTIQFRDLPIPYKYIQKSGEYITGHFVPGVYWGREITLRDDSLFYYHYEGTSDRFWWIRYSGKRID